MHKSIRWLACLVGSLLLLGAFAGCSSDSSPSGAAGAPATSAPVQADEGLPASHRSKVHLQAGEIGHLASEDSIADVTVSNPKIIKAPEYWGNSRIVVATVAINVTQGRYDYNETAFALVLPNGTRIDASTVASDDGLPARALGNGTLTAPDKAKGLVTFDHAPKSLAGMRIQLRDDPEGRDWQLG